MNEYYLPLIDRKEIGDGTAIFWFDISGTDFRFKAGQNVDIGIGDVRTFSIASSPNDHMRLMIASRRIHSSNFKKQLLAMPLGEKMRFQGPQGSFILQNDSKRHAVFLAGGIGITPFLSMATFATEEKLPHRITLLHSASKPSRLAFFEELRELVLRNPAFSYIPTVTDFDHVSWEGERGRIDTSMIRKHIPDLSTATFYVAGPPGFTSGMYELLEKMHVDTDHIKTEEFSGY